MKQLSYMLILTAVIMMSCKSSEDSSNGTDSGTNTEITSETNGSASETDNNGEDISDLDEQVSERQPMTGRELIGQWEWVKTNCCGRMNSDTYPEEGAEKKIISFDKDGNAKYYSGDGGKVLVEQTFKIGELGTQKTVTIGELQPALFYVQGDELTLNWQYIDLQIEYYKRVEE